MIIFDAHLDLAWNALDWNRNLQLPCAAIRRMEKDLGYTEKGRGANTVSFPDLRRGKVVTFVATVLARLFRPGVIPPIQLYAQPEAAFGAAMGQLHYYRGLEQQELLRLIKDWPTLEGHIHAWKAEEDSATLPLGCILSMEGADAVLRPDQVQEWWDAGLRIIGPCLYGVSPYGHGTGTEGGFFPQGRVLLKEMERVGMILDVTHLSDQCFDEAMNLFGGRVLASHHNNRTLVPHQRQLTDAQTKQVIARGGVIGHAFDIWMIQPNYVRGVTQAAVPLERIGDHIDRVCQLAGNTRHAALGTDLDGGFGREQSQAIWTPSPTCNACRKSWRGAATSKRISKESCTRIGSVSSKKHGPPRPTRSVPTSQTPRPVWRGSIMHPRFTSVPSLLLTMLLFASTCRAGDGPKPLRIHVIAGGEYDPVPSMTEFKRFLEAQYRVECTTSFYSGTGSPSKLENLDNLKSADLLILFARRMALREDQMKLIRGHWEQGKPIVGIRTACHAFQKADNEMIDRKLFGGDYGGPSSNGGYKTAPAKGQENHPVLKGVGEIKAAKYAYGNGPLAESAMVLQIVGRIKDKDFPVTWVNTYKGGRYFYTSLGAPDDFQQESMKRLLVNAVFWTTQRDPVRMKK